MEPNHLLHGAGGVRRGPGREGVRQRGGRPHRGPRAALSGGAGYLNGGPLARAYRDVKAGSFMHPLGANRAYDHLAHAALDEQTTLH